MLKKLKDKLLSLPVYVASLLLYLALIGPTLISARSHEAVALGIILLVALGYWTKHIINRFSN